MIFFFKCGDLLCNHNSSLIVAIWWVFLISVFGDLLRLRLSLSQLERLSWSPDQLPRSWSLIKFMIRFLRFLSEIRGWILITALYILMMNFSADSDWTRSIQSCIAVQYRVRRLWSWVCHMTPPTSAWWCGSQKDLAASFTSIQDERNNKSCTNQAHSSCILYQTALANDRLPRPSVGDRWVHQMARPSSALQGGAIEVGHEQWGRSTLRWLPQH